MENDKIEVGDFVDVHFIKSESLFQAEVLYTPAATGDCWHLKDYRGQIHYVQLFETMRLTTKGAAQ